jgi:hypothetical protein
MLTNFEKSNDSTPPKRYNFSPLYPCGKVVPHFNLFFKNKKNFKVVGITLPHKQSGEKLYF